MGYDSHRGEGEKEDVVALQTLVAGSILVVTEAPFSFYTNPLSSPLFSNRSSQSYDFDNTWLNPTRALARVKCVGFFMSNKIPK